MLSSARGDVARTEHAKPPSAEAAALEVFRQAIERGDETAWRDVVDTYRGFLLAQAGRRLVRGLVLEDDGSCVDRAFQRFWGAGRAGRIRRFDDLPAIVKYLKMCLGSVLLDEARARRRQTWVSMDDLTPDNEISTDPLPEIIGRLARRELWAAVERELTDPKERLVARLSLIGGLSPREILTRYPGTFQDVVHVYRVKRNMIDRLRRSRAIQAFID
jgi:DNA-directed RNA polymerase specialized sigma24 family protein